MTEPVDAGARAALEGVVDEAAAHLRRHLPFLRMTAAADGYAPFRARALAYLVDGALITAVLALSGVLSFVEGAWVAATLAAAAQVLPFVYLTISHYGTGQTMGKRLMGIRVIDEVSAQLSLRQSALRSAVAIGGPLAAAAVIVGLQHAHLPFWALAGAAAAAAIAGNTWALVDCLSALGDGGRRTIHDRVAGTVVVAKRGLPAQGQ